MVDGAAYGSGDPGRVTWRVPPNIEPIGRRGSATGASDTFLLAPSDVTTSPDRQDLILVGTHHKTGTTWMLSLFEGFCAALGDRLHGGPQAELPRSARVFFQDHSRFDFASLDRAYRGLHVIRDPRDVLISGARYHARSAESWLHRRNWRLFGLTYQEAIRRRRSLCDAVAFEMDHAGGATIREMLAWDRTRPEFFEAKYEDLIVDRELTLFRRILSFLGYDPAVVPVLERIVRERSMYFGGRVADPTHVSDGRPEQWREVFDDRLRRRFFSRFGDALNRLGYETDDLWRR